MLTFLGWLTWTKGSKVAHFPRWGSSDLTTAVGLTSRSLPNFLQGGGTQNLDTWTLSTWGKRQKGLHTPKHQLYVRYCLFPWWIFSNFRLWWNTHKIKFIFLTIYKRTVQEDKAHSRYCAASLQNSFHTAKPTLGSYPKALHSSLSPAPGNQTSTFCLYQIWLL